MLVENLRVVHLRKNSAQTQIELDLPGAFSLDTCQRRVWVFTADQFSTVEQNGVEFFCGSAAYRFLLRMAVGLESDIPGETEVFGQLKQAWNDYALSHARFFSDLQFLFQKLFEDVKYIRTAYLQSSGGDSYGSLVRALVRRQFGKKQSVKILVIGAGSIASTIAPWLLSYELYLLNRSMERARALKAALETKTNRAKIEILPADKEEAALRNVDCAIVCIPEETINQEKDYKRIIAWQEGLLKNRQRFLIHLGCLDKTCSVWNRIPNLLSLNDVFSLKRERGEQRSLQLTQAANACDELSKRRAEITLRPLRSLSHTEVPASYA